MKKRMNEQSLPTKQQVEVELKRVDYRTRYRKVLRNTIYTLIIVAAIAVLIASLVLPVLQISGTSMEPTLSDKEIVVLVKTGNMKQGDLCGFSYSNKILIKRVIGLPGDFITISKDGTVMVNGDEIDEPYLTEKSLGECDIEFPYQVPENHYFVLGDHRSTSVDSRNSVIGCVSKEQFIGKIIFRIYPIKDISFIK